MKKILFSLLIILTCACSMKSNNAQEAVENYLNKYKNLDEEVLLYLDNNVNITDFNESELKKYKSVIKRQYTSLNYKIKNVYNDGINSTVTVEVSVFDYVKAKTKAINYSNENKIEFMVSNKFDLRKYNNFLINTLNEEKSKVTYTIEFKLVKEGTEYKIININDEIIQKLQGVYEWQ